MHLARGGVEGHAIERVLAAVDGTQYVAVATGRVAFHANSFGVLVPELATPVERSAVLWVFAVEP